MRARATTARATPSDCLRRAQRGFTALEFLAKSTLYSATEPVRCAPARFYWAGIGRVVYGLSEKGLKAQIRAHDKSPHLGLSCEIVFSAGQRATEVIGPLLEDEAAALQADFWKARDAHRSCVVSG